MFQQLDNPKKRLINFKRILAGFIMLAASTAVLVYSVNKEFNKEIEFTRAGTDHSFSGFAWSENIGWISFNATNCDSDCNSASCTSDGPGFHPGCPSTGSIYSNYGVDLDASGNLSGYAWSEHVGWIYFGPDADLTANGYWNIQIANDAPEAPKEWANLSYKGNSASTSGWALILSFGDEGWIKMGDDNYVNWLGQGPKIDDLSNGEMSGWAWNENSNNLSTGWISFSSDNCDTDGDGTYEGGGEAGGAAPAGCPGSGSVNEYRVLVDPSFLNQPPTAEFDPMDHPGFCIDDDPFCYAPACACGNYCILRPQLTWSFNDPDGDSQAWYQIVFATSDLTGSLDTLSENISGTLPLVTPQRAGAANSFYPTTYVNIANMAYDQDYYAWIKVGDTAGLESDWTQFYDSADADEDGSDYTFTTYKNPFPDPYFYWLPPDFSIGEQVKFFDDSTNYVGGSASQCQDINNCSNVEWWVSTVPEYALSDTYFDASSTDSLIFNSSENFAATSTIQDIYGYTCGTTTSSGITELRLPTWIESR